MNKLYTIVAVVILAGLGLANALFTVDQTQYAIVLQFGDPVDVKKTPGLHIKIPFIQNVVYLDNRLMEYDVPTTIIYTNDKKNMVVDAFTRWRVADPLLFYKRFKSSNGQSITRDAQARLGDVIIGRLRAELGHHIMSDIISQSRGTIMESVKSDANRTLMGQGGEGEASGLEVVDVRIKRADLPTENQKAVYERMKAERDQQATKYRSEGLMAEQKIKADADRGREEKLAQAQRTSEEIKGEADAQAAAIYAEAFNLDPEFYAFVRSLDSYRAAFSGNSTLVLSPESMDYLKYFGQINPEN